MLDFFSHFDQTIRFISIIFVPALMGIILHEIGHGWMALQQGDRTAQFMGRLSLNPIRHIDPMGLLVFILTAVVGGFIFGWAKPVPVDVRNFKNPRQGLMLVALAGPMTNVLLAVLFGVLLKLEVSFFADQLGTGNGVHLFLFNVFKYGIIINLGLAVLNLLPIPPLDGSKVVSYFMPARMAYSYLSAGRYGMLILVVLMLAGIIWPIVRYPIYGGYNLIVWAMGLA